jgi:serine/threonine protein kinase
MLIPGYRIIRLLGEGGMAKVWLAVQEKFEREVALKIMSPLLAKHDAQYKERFVREARIIAQLMHPNIVTIFDVGVHDDLHFIAMEYVPGKDLKNASATLSLRENLSAVKQIALALHFAHQKSYIHRDIKPENILIHDHDGRAVLTDFGIARLLSSQDTLTQTGIAIGTPAFMSPEQAMGRATDARSDLYSLGAVLFYLLCGRAPYEADSAVAIGIKHAMEPVPVLPSSLALLQPLLNQSMAKMAEQRFENGQVFAQALDRLSDQISPALEQAWRALRGTPRVEMNVDATRIQRAAIAPKPAQLAHLLAPKASLPTPQPSPPQSAQQSIQQSPKQSSPTPAVKRVNVGISRSPVAPKRAQFKHPASELLPPSGTTVERPHLRNKLSYTMLAILLVFAPLLSSVLASFDLFKTTGGHSIYFSAAQLVHFLGNSTAVFALWIIARKLAYRWPARLKRYRLLAPYLLPLIGLVLVYVLSLTSETMLRPALGDSFYNWSFIALHLFCALWLQLLTLGRGTRLTRLLGP